MIITGCIGTRSTPFFVLGQTSLKIHSRTKTATRAFTWYLHGLGGRLMEDEGAVCRPVTNESLSVGVDKALY